MNNFFDHIFCVNLDRRQDKWMLCEKEFKRWGLDVERFSAIDGNIYWKPQYTVKPGSIGNCMSKIAIINIAKERGYKNFLLLEDDVEFAPDFNHKFSEWSQEVPLNWDMLWLGGNHNLWHQEDFNKINMYSPHLMRINETYSTHAFALKNNIYEAVLKALEPLQPEDDIILAGIQKTCRAFSFRPNLAYQRAGMSDVHNIHTDYDFLRKL